MVETQEDYKCQTSSFGTLPKAREARYNCSVKDSSARKPVAIFCTNLQMFQNQLKVQIFKDHLPQGYLFKALNTCWGGPTTSNSPYS